MANVDLPFKVEYAKSNRASCKGCKGLIPKDELRIASVIQSKRFDGKMTSWFHFACFFTKQKLRSTGDIDGFSNIKYEDQKRIEKKVCSAGSLAELVSEGKATASEKKKAILEFSIGYAKTQRSCCKSCEYPIPKDDIRISKMNYESEKARAFGPYPVWYDLECFVAIRESLGWFLSSEDLPGIMTITGNDRNMLKEILPKIQPPKRPAEEANVAPKLKKSKPDEERALKKQSDKIFSLQKKLESEMTKRQLIEIFEYNDLHVPSGISRLVEWLADAILFGVCSPCPECKQKALCFDSNTYKCHGDFSEFTSCTYTTSEPVRSKLKVPKEFLAAFPFLKGNVGKRLILSNLAEPTVTLENKAQKLQSEKPLKDCAIFLDACEQPRELVEAKIQRFGGQKALTVEEDVFCVISTQERVDQMVPEIKRAKELDIFVVSADFVEKCQSSPLNLIPYKLADWGDEARVSKMISDVQKAAFERALTLKSQGFTKQDNRAFEKVPLDGVDRDSGLHGIAKVYERDGDVYSCVLGLADVSRGTNSYYKIQLLASKRDYYVFRSWGRIGTTIGGKKLEKHSTLQDAILEFKAVFLDKTGNDWESRKNFVKKPKYFNIIEMDLPPGEPDIKQILATSSDSKLPLPVQELICNIFDVKIMNQLMKQFEIDLAKMPLGKLSKDQISKAYTILSELQGLVDTKSSRLKFLDASNRFFNVIPHDFGMLAPPLIDNHEMIKEKVDMLDSLTEMELASSMLKQKKPLAKIPVDHHYMQLKVNIQVLDRDGATFGLLQKYLDTTHADTHSCYKLEIMDVFTIERQGEAQRFKPFKRLHNHKLLWHGSRLTNFVGILSQGLRIAPKEAPSSGYMFGKGIYFADMVSKSANYCCANHQNPVGLLLLCDVALGDMYELANPEYVTKLPRKKHSVKGVGATQPVKEEKLDNVTVPLGPAETSDKQTVLLYNEYIVYDVSQVQIKYLLKVNFNFDS